MIVTVTANPALDRTVPIGSLDRGAVIRGARSWSEPSGKGVNVSLALGAHGHAATAVLPVGGVNGEQLKAMLLDLDASIAAVAIGDNTRVNISLLEADGTVTKINERGPTLTPQEARALLGTALDTARDATWLACCGSLPPGVPTGFYGELVTRAREIGLHTVVDSSGQALEAGVEAGPDVIKPNLEELIELVGHDLMTLGDVIDAAKIVIGRGAGAVLASLGAQGAVLVDDEGVVFGRARVARPVSSVGAGDALLAGFLSAGGSGAPAMRAALRWAATAVSHAGTLLPGQLDDVDVEISDSPDLAHPVH